MQNHIVSKCRCYGDVNRCYSLTKTNLKQMMFTQGKTSSLITLWSWRRLWDQVQNGIHIRTPLKSKILCVDHTHKKQQVVSSNICKANSAIVEKKLEMVAPLSFPDNLWVKWTFWQTMILIKLWSCSRCGMVREIVFRQWNLFQRKFNLKIIMIFFQRTTWCESTVIENYV